MARTQRCRSGTAVPVLLLFGVLAVGNLASAGLIVKWFVHDIFVLFDAMWRASLGQTPHIDFHTPIGQAYYWPFRLLGAFGDHDALTVIHAHVLVGALLAAGILLTLQRRLSPPLLFAASLTLLALAMTPRDIDHGITGYSWLAPYNRWSWAILMLVAMIAALPPASRRFWADGIVLGLAIGLLFYVKLTFFVAALALLAGGLALRQLALRPILIAFGVGCAMALIVELSWHNNAAYLADIRMAFRAGLESDDRLGAYKLLRTARLGAVFGVGIVVLFWLRRPSLSPVRWLIFWWKPLLLSAWIIGVGLFVTVQNHPNLEFAHGVIALLVAAELTRRRTPEDLAYLPPVIDRHSGGAWCRGTSIALISLALIFPILDAVAIFAHAVESRGVAICPVPALVHTQGGHLIAPINLMGGNCPDKAQALASEPSTDIGRFDYQKIGRAMDLIDRFGRSGDIVLALDFSNPYPFFLRATPPRGALIWWHHGRDYGAGDHPPVAPMLRSATLILQTRYEPPQDDGHGAAAWQVYGGDVARAFIPVAQNDAFRLWRVRDVRNGAMH